MVVRFYSLKTYCLFTFYYIIFYESMVDPLPLFLNGKVCKGFGRGSKELGIPTANLDDVVVQSLPRELENGIYFGWSQLESVVYPAVMSIGWNPFYKNTKRTIEVHLLHRFDKDFYGAHLKSIVLGYLRPEKNFASKEELIEAIHKDIDDASKKIRLKHFADYQMDDFFKNVGAGVPQ